MFFVLAAVAAASVGTYAAVPRFCPKETQLFVALPFSVPKHFTLETPMHSSFATPLLCRLC